MNPIKRAINWSLGKVGLELRRKSAADSSDRLTDFLRQLRQLGFAPESIYDIGANRGLWSAKVLPVFPKAQYVLFEPQRKLGPDINRVAGGRANVKWRQCAVSDAVGTAEFAEVEWDVCSRLSSELEEGWEPNANRIKVETTTVDEEVRRNGGRVPDLLKIDAEGHDFKVLDGARQTLGRAEVVMVEAAVNCPTMENTVSAVVSRMADEGYALTGIVDLNDFHVPGQQWAGVLWLIDLAFCRVNGAMLGKMQDPGAEANATAAVSA